MKKVLLAAGMIAALGAFAPVDAGAVTQSVTANISFDSPLAITKNADINFGTVRAGVADTYTITTAGSVSAAGSGAYLYGTTSAASLTITGSTSQTISISVGGYTANGGVTPQNATCAYNGGSAGSCSLSSVAAPGAGKTLLLGVQAVVDGTQTGGSSAAPTFTVTVVYG